jgi:4-hydroxy-2-oxoheptanedioate aldolase
VEHANREVFLVLQIEDKEAVERIDEIAAVPGFDLLFVGPGDLTLSYGLPMQFNHPQIEAAFDCVAQAAARHGKWWGTTSGTPEAAQKVLDRGGRMITAGGDHGALLKGLTTSFREFSTIGIRG